MKTFYYVLISSLLLVGCSTKKSDIEVASTLSGYWEIEEVLFPDGTKKVFKVNTTLDYFSFKGTQGTRTKVKPQLDGSFLETQTVEKCSIYNSQDSILIIFTTPYDSWEEQLIYIAKDKFKTQTQDQTIYSYKRFNNTTFTKK